MRKNGYDIVIIGAGAVAGFLACFMNGCGLREKPRVLIIEKLSKPFKKIAASGNGRCNYSNKNISPRDYFSLKPDGAFNKFFFDKIKAFDFRGYLDENLIYSRFDEYGRLFPFTNSAKTIISFMESNLKLSGIETIFDSACRKADYDNKNHVFKIECENLKTGASLSVKSGKLVFACGGAAYPQLGTDGAAFDIIKKMGHSVTGPAPGICAFETRDNHFHKLSGIKLEARLKYKNFDRTGEILFTDYGISGPNALYLSSLVSQGIFSGEKVEVSIDFLPSGALTAAYFASAIKRCAQYSNLDIFSGVLNRDFLKAFFQKTGFAVERASVESVNKTHAALKNHLVTVTRMRPFNEAQVSLGGVSCAEIIPETLESRIVKNLYFAGEVIDYTGGCGGYNLHQAALCAKIITNALFKGTAR